MRGTLVCEVNDNEHGRAALEMGVELSDRLGLRLVLAYASDGPAAGNGADEGAALVSMSAAREGAARLLAQLAAEHGVADRAERRFGTGDRGRDRSDRRGGGSRLDCRRGRNAQSASARPRQPPRRPAWQRDGGAGLDRAARRPGGRMTNMNGGQR